MMDVSSIFKQSFQASAINYFLFIYYRNAAMLVTKSQIEALTLLELMPPINYIFTIQI